MTTDFLISESLWPRQARGMNTPVSPLSALTDVQRDCAQQRFALLQPHLREDVSLISIANDADLSVRTLHEWLARYRKHGLIGLVPRSRSDRGNCCLPDELRQFIEGLALQQKRPSAASVHRKVKLVATTEGWRVPSYRVVAAVIQQLSPALTTLAHDGAKAYGEAFELLYRREASRPNEIWQADHTPLDIWVLDEKGEPARPWFTAIVDDHSRAVAGWRLSFQAPSAFQTALTLRQAIWRKEDARWTVCGIPEIFYTDHGSDFTSQHMEQVAADLKFQAIFSTVGQPRGRGRIERFFATVNQLFLCEQPGYTRPETPRAKPVLTIMQLERRMSDFLLDGYQQRVHKETGCAPQARWEAGGFLPQMAESLEQLDLLLLTVARARQVRRDGIHFQNLRYLEPTLAAFVGEPVTIRYDPRDLAEIRIFHHDRFLCRAICQEIVGQVISLKEIIRARQSQRRELRTQLKNRSVVVDRLLEAHKVDTAETTETVPEPLESKPLAPSPLRRYVHDD